MKNCKVGWKMSAGISSLWPEIECNNKLGTITEITSIKIDRAAKTIGMDVFCSKVDAEYIDYFKSFIKNRFVGYRFSINLIFPKEAFDESAVIFVINELKKGGKPVNGIFDEACIYVGNENIELILKHGGESLLNTIGFEAAFNQKEQELFGSIHKISIIVDKVKKIARKYEDEDQNKLKKQYVAKKKEQKRKPRVNGKSEYLALENDEYELLAGGKISLSDIIPISNIENETGRFTVWGEIFSVEEFETKRGGKVITISMTDYSGSVRIKHYFKANEDGPLTKIKYGDTVVVRGDIEHDRYTGDFIMNPLDIIRVTPQKRNDSADEKRVELHLHTNMSVMDAIPNAKQVVDFAYSLGHKAVAITDHGVVQAFPEAAKAYSSIKAKDPDCDFKVIYGLEGYYYDDTKIQTGGEKSNRNLQLNHIIILAKNLSGLKNLYRLVSTSHINYFYYRPRIPLSELNRYREGLILGSACEQGEIFRALMKGAQFSELEAISEKYDYFEIQPISNNSFMIRNGTVDNEESLKELNRQIIELGKRLNKPVVATCDAHFINERDGIYREILMSVKSSDESDSFTPLFYRTTEEMLEEFNYLDKIQREEVVIKAPGRIADMIEPDIKPIPDGTFTPTIDDAEEIIADMANTAMGTMFGNNPDSFITERMDKELGSIMKNGFSTLYIIAKKIVDRSKQDGYYVGSRGSVGSSLVAYILGISDVNPLPAHYLCKRCRHMEFVPEAGSGFDLADKRCPVCNEMIRADGHNIPFETFLGFNGEKAPDIDLNFSSEYQGRAHRFTEELFGSEHVFKAGTISTLKEKTSFGFVKKYLEENNLKVSGAEEERLVFGCAGVKRTTGQHPGGMVLVPNGYDITDFTPIQHPADSKDSGVVTTHFDFDSLKETLLKLDILGHDVPTMYKRLEDMTGVKISDIPMNDPIVYKLFTSTEPLGIKPEDAGTSIGTLGIPEMGTQFVEQILIESDPKNFSDLLQVSGLSHGTGVWRGNAQQLIKDGVCTISEVIGTRDSIMVYLMSKGVEPQTAFTITEFTRRGYASEQFTEELQVMVKNHGVSDWYIESCKRIKYMFPKAHAAAYVMSAIHISWFKLYYPLEYYATYFTVRGGDIDPDAALGGIDAAKRSMSELKRKISEDGKKKAKDEDVYTTLQITIEMLCRGFSFLPVDFYKSEATAYIIEDNKLRLPFISIKGVGETVANALKDAAGKGKYISAEDMLSEPGITQSLIDILDAAGALGTLPKTSQLSLF